MLPPFIIEQIRRREEDSVRREEIRPSLEVPKAPSSRSEDAEEDEDDRDRGVLIIDLG